jgi:hypothetical protein
MPPARYRAGAGQRRPAAALGALALTARRYLRVLRRDGPSVTLSGDG